MAAVYAVENNLVAAHEQSVHRVLAPQRLPWRAILLASRAAGTSSGAMSFAAPLIGPATMANSVGGLLLNATPMTLREGGMLALEKLL